MGKLTLSSTRTLKQWFNFVAYPDGKLLQQKYYEHRQFSIYIALFFSLMWAGMWYWDKIRDPVGASNTIGLRLLFLLFLLVPVALFLNKRINSWLEATCLLLALAAEANFIEIINCLAGAKGFGIGGFLSHIFLPLLLFRCFSLRMSLIYILLATVMPHLAHAAGLFHTFRPFHYMTLVWPTALLVTTTAVIQSNCYYRLYSAMQELERASNTDPLTGAKNRRYFATLLTTEINRAKRINQSLSLLMIDIDHFKKVNDLYGHQTGDQVIRLVVKVCERSIRQYDTVVRLGGEEFAVLLTGSDLKQGFQVAERIRLTIEASKPRCIDGQYFQFTVSIGVTDYSLEDDDEKAILHRTDKALYQAKNKGRNIVVPLSEN